MNDEKLNTIKPANIKQWAIDDRPREKLLQKGANALSDSELLAIMLRAGNKHETAVDLARRILKDADDNLLNLSKHTVKSLSKYNGVGEAKAITIIAALELGRRSLASEAINKQQISCSKDAFELILPFLHNQPYEQIWAFFLNRHNKLLCKEQISTGSIVESVIDPGRILRIALDAYAVGIILFHNHPSGNLKPSEADIKLTQKIQKAAAIFNIKLLDHIIVGNNNYFSFADDNLLDNNI
jgi:DNA repair protein RadC